MKALSSILIPIVGLFATLPLNELIVNMHLLVALGLFFLLTLVHEPVMWRVLFVVSVAYAFIFAGFGLQFLPAFILLVIFRARKVPTVVKTLLFLVAVSVSNNPLSPAFVVAYMVLVHHERLVQAWSASQTRIFVLLLLATLFLPLPRFGLFDHFGRLPNQRSDFPTSEQRNEALFSDEQPRASKEASPVAGRGQNVPTTASERSAQIRTLSDFLFELNIAMSAIALLLLVWWFVVQLKREGVPLKDILVRSFTRFVLVTTLFSLLFAFVLPLLLNYLDSSLLGRKLDRGELLHTATEESDTSIDRFQGGRNDGAGQREDVLVEGTGPGDQWLRLLFQTLGVAISAVVIFSVIGKIVELLRIPRFSEPTDKDGEEKNALRFDTNFSYDDILGLTGRLFVEHAYLFLRKTFFSEMDHLTPYELLDAVSHERRTTPTGSELRVLSPIFAEKLSRLTKEFVSSRYAGIETAYGDKEIDELKTAFVALCDCLWEVRPTK